jgi:hypothetical protein
MVLLLIAVSPLSLAALWWGVSTGRVDLEGLAQRVRETLRRTIQVHPSTPGKVSPKPSPERASSTGDTVKALKQEGRILFPAAVAGESHYQANIRRVAAVGKPVQLIPEPTNKYDRNAVRIDVDGLTIGYIPRDIARVAQDDEWEAIIAAVNDQHDTIGIVLGITKTYRDLR